MATSFEEINSLFLSQITDYELFNYSREELAMAADQYLIRSLVNIQELETNVQDIDVENKQFNTDLSIIEKLIIAKSMKYEWVQDRIYQENLMRQNIGDRDYKAVQGTAYLDSLRVLSNNLSREIRRDLLRYDWGKTSSYDGLV